jgi:hypothetical protein
MNTRSALVELLEHLWVEDNKAALVDSRVRMKMTDWGMPGAWVTIRRIQRVFAHTVTCDDVGKDFATITREDDGKTCLVALDRLAL